MAAGESPRRVPGKCHPHPAPSRKSRTFLRGHCRPSPQANPPGTGIGRRATAGAGKAGAGKVALFPG